MNEYTLLLIMLIIALLIFRKLISVVLGTFTDEIYNVCNDLKKEQLIKSNETFEEIAELGEIHTPEEIWKMLNKKGKKENK